MPRTYEESQDYRHTMPQYQMDETEIERLKTLGLHFYKIPRKDLELVGYIDQEEDKDEGLMFKEKNVVRFIVPLGSENRKLRERIEGGLDLITFFKNEKNGGEKDIERQKTLLKKAKDRAESYRSLLSHIKEERHSSSSEGKLPDILTDVESLEKLIAMEEGHQEEIKRRIDRLESDDETYYSTLMFRIHRAIREAQTYTASIAFDEYTKKEHRGQGGGIKIE